MDDKDLEAIVTRFRGIHVDEDDEAVRQQMEHSIQKYNDTARENNIRFVRECVEAVAAAVLETERERLDRMAHVFFAMANWETNTDYDVYPHLKPKQLGDHGWPPERLDRVLELPQIRRDSLKGPALSKEFSATLVDEMTKLVFGEHTEACVVPRELIAFFSCVSGVKDLGYNRIGLCEFEAPVKEGVSREEMHMALEDKYLAPEEIEKEMPFVSEQLEVAGGFRFGWNTGTWRDEVVRQWHSLYLFCRPENFEEDDAEGEINMEDKTDADWGWRVVVYLVSDCNEGIMAPVKIFDTISVFLEWYGSWYDRLDRERLLRELVENEEFFN